MEASLFSAIVQRHIEAARHGNNHLFQLFVSMARTLSPTGHIIKVINATYVKRNVSPALNECQVSSTVLDFRETDKVIIVQGPSPVVSGRLRLIS